MASRGAAPGGMKVKRVMTQAINLIFEFMKNVSKSFSNLLKILYLTYYKLIQI